MRTFASSILHISASTRLILAMFRLYAGIAESFGRALMDMLYKQYPDQIAQMKADPKANPAYVGNKLLQIAKKENQGSEDRAEDAIQNWFTYLVQSKWNFSKDFDNYSDALKAAYSNIRTRAISKSMDTSRKKKHEKSIDEAYGVRGESGGEPEGGESRMPTPSETNLGKALDDQVAIKSFIELIDDLIPDLRASLSDETRALFDLVFFDEIGSFGSDVDENMNQASEFKEKRPDLYEAHEKRWSGFVGDTRKKLLDEIWNFIKKHMTPDEYDTLKEVFFSDTSPKAVRKIERQKIQSKKDEQQGKDERKLARFKYEEGQGTLDPKEMKSYRNLEKKLRDQGVNVDDIWPEEKPDDKTWELHNKNRAAASLIKITARVAACWV